MAPVEYAESGEALEMSAIPKRLVNEPLVEVIWQLQFDDPNAGDLLPGLLFTQLKEYYPGLEMYRLPSADIPEPVRKSDPNLQYTSRLRMEGKDSPFIWQVGDRVVTLNCRKPYVGWNKFKTAIEQLIEIIEKNALVEQLLRHSLRYLDLLTLDEPPNLSALRLDLVLGSHTLNRHNMRLRVEMPSDDYQHNVQIGTPATSNLPEGQITGTLVDIETVPMASPASWDDVRAQLETMHDRSKELFFRDILSEDALNKLEPEY